MSIMRIYQRKWMWVLTGTVLGAGLSGALTYRQHRGPVTPSPAPDGGYCDRGIGGVQRYAATAPAGAGPRSDRWDNGRIPKRPPME